MFSAAVRGSASPVKRLMSEPLTFMMGKHPAPVPGDLRYCKNHMWCRPGEDGVHVFGFTAYAVRLMQDVYFLEWRIEPGLVTAKQEIGFIETQKATSGLYAPGAGRIVRFNAALLEDPGTINLDNYGRGWLFELTGELTDTLDPSAYFAHLEAGWEATQRVLKGQINASDE
ncbi:Glycine cleavage H-protein OS=Pirellula staleyi (strain ATCC 27377 / DSM 6068 / ICPB 4128) GN=Psta_4504 PE=4 SV=1: GCV_H [Gemmata massiliana]|uniref:Lipoyl-binding domain-containing protein n=2 Tax=Gemmata massiliana TaxID=1210884 RepID=A0A6P2D2Z6_9BACT|nr:Glycine cleavage H-protein OS=Pirellula staleyi (strain ATCC 27377 / DSM 6068 / ICPB 4128) GN=Psta_4504 PE=4 SV=1: GCV_H [Gemmata massiliana]